MPRTLSDPDARREIVARLERVEPDTPRRWGRMTAGAMVAHLADTMRGMLRERRIEPVPTHARRLIRLLALSPIPFPRGRIRAPAQVDPDRAGTAPGDFATDRTELVALLERYVALPPEEVPGRHPILGPLTPAQWSRFHHKHWDHHLRQFGV